MNQIESIHTNDKLNVYSHLTMQAVQTMDLNPFFESKPHFLIGLRCHINALSNLD